MSPSGPVLSLPWIVATALLVLAVGTGGMLAQVEPFASWYYLFAWYPTIAIADAWGHARDRRTLLLLSRPGVLGALLGWSAAFWFSFELWNLRLGNWYYVNVSDQWLLRWTGTVLAFATVLPAVFAITKLLAAYKVGEGARAHTRVTPHLLSLCLAIGLVSSALVLLWPARFYPLVWGVVFFIVAPFNYRRGGRGILRQLEAGDWGPAIRLLIAGAICGLAWEIFNFGARAKWIYTVPGFENFKLFEMPVLGFLGFPPFALECYEMYTAAVYLGLARDWEAGDGGKSSRPRAPLKRAGVGAVLAALSILTLVLMDHSTIDSMTPRPVDLPAVDAVLGERLADLGVGDASELSDLLDSPELVTRLGIGEEAKAELADQVELALLKGIGARNTANLVAASVARVEDLAGIEAEDLERRLLAVAPEVRWRPARLRVWIRAARSQLGLSGSR